MYKLLYDVYLDAALLLSGMLYIALHWRGDIPQIAGVSIATIATALWLLARVELGNAYSIAPMSKDLRTTGPYRYVRHPMYVFGTLAILGIVVAIEEPILYLLPAFTALLQFARTRREEAVLHKRFGARFRAYKRATWF